MRLPHSAVNASPQSHSDQANRLNTLAAWLGKRFKQTGSTDDLDRAIDITDTAVNRTQDHIEAARYLSKRSLVEEGCDAGVEGNTLEFSKVENVNADGAKGVQEVVDDNVQLEIHACPPTVAQDSRQSCIKRKMCATGA